MLISCPLSLVTEEEYEDVDDYFGDEEYNVKESEEGDWSNSCCLHD